MLRGGAPLLLIAALAGCGMIPPEPQTEAAEAVFNLYNIVLVMGLVVFLGVEGFIVYSVFRYRRRDDRLPDQLHGNNLVEIIWTAIPTVIVLILFVLSVIALGTVEARSPNPGVTIEVDGFQWQWQFRYLDQDDDPGNDFTVVGTPAEPPVMAVPVGEPVRLILKSDDVIHSFFVPQFLIKRDLMPVPEGQDPNEMEFTVTEVGTYAGQCAEFCGDLHARMTFSVDAMTRADFDTWLEAGRSGAPPPPPSVEPGGEIVQVVADRIAFDPLELRAPADEPFTLRFINLEAVIHNVVIFDASSTEVFRSGDLTGPDAEGDFGVPALPAGEYTFICEYHPVPDMTGTLIIE
ncbi:MAG: cytochrome c oxidase subunit II [Candidatus Limnocylindria bacterium]